MAATVCRATVVVVLSADAVESWMIWLRLEIALVASFTNSLMPVFVRAVPPLSLMLVFRASLAVVTSVVFAKLNGLVLLSITIAAAFCTTTFEMEETAEVVAAAVESPDRSPTETKEARAVVIWLPTIVTLSRTVSSSAVWFWLKGLYFKVYTGGKRDTECAQSCFGRQV